MKPRAYIETTIPSYLTARTSHDPLVLARQQSTRDWWERRSAFDLFVSELVLKECEAGDPTAAAARLAALEGIPLLDQPPEVDRLAAALMSAVWLPPKAESDAFHIATAAFHQVQ